MKLLLLIIRIVALIAMALIALTMPLRKKRLSKKIGECKLQLSRKKSMLFIAVFCFAPLMILLQWIRDFEPYIHIILSCVAVFAVELAVRERVLDSLSGVYDSFLIVDGRIIEKSDIENFPTLEYENAPETYDENSESYIDPQYRKALKIVSKKSGVFFVGFENDDERNKSVEILKNWV